jgi:peptidoglycan/xylan/chitin deacetylase (PgdA/CDA1 family)
MVKRILTRLFDFGTLERIRDWMSIAVYYSGLGWLLKPLFKPGAAILLYHSVGGNRVFSDNVLKETSFRRQLAFLMRTRTIVPLRAMVDKLEAGEPVPADWLVLTFDDGYKDFVETAVPILKELQVPATVFIPSGVLSGELELLPDALTRIVAECPKSSIEMESNGRSLSLPLRTEKQRRDAVLRLAFALRSLDSSERAECVAEVARCCGVAPVGPSTEKYMSEADVLTCPDLVEVGAHTVTHPNLAATPADLAKREIETSKATLTEAWKREVDSFAYPFGKGWSFSHETAELVKEAGFRCGLTTLYGFVGLDADRFALPRIGVRDSLTRLKLHLLGFPIWAARFNGVNGGLSARRGSSKGRRFLIGR